MSTTTLDQPHEQAPAPKQAIVGSLPEVEALIREYVAHLAPRDRLSLQLTFSGFLIWLRKKIETERNGENQ
jgi:hypothetical protein